MIVTLISFIIVLGVVVFVHELGHFLAAKAAGARVEVFSLGFPPKLAGIKRGETEYRIGWIPLGGYVKIAGMVDESLEGEESITGAPDEFMSKSTPAKAFIITAGVMMNLLLGFLIYSGITLIEGEPKLVETATIGSVAEEYPAGRAGLLPGDRIIAIDETRIGNWEDLTEAVHSRPGDTLLVRWRRGADTLSALIPTRTEKIFFEGASREVGMIGVGPKVEMIPAGLFRAVERGGALTYMYLKLSAQSLAMLITGRASIKELTGPVGILALSGETARQGWVSFLGFIGLISVSIGFLNILPFPVLDGGYLVYILIEAMIRKPIPARVKLVLQQVGMALLLLLVVVVTYHDIFRFLVR